MSRLRIYTNIALPPEAARLLREGAAPHEVVFSVRPSASALGLAAPDELLATADVAFGQPDPASVLQAPRLRWLQVNSAGYTRYDTPEFREGAAARGLLVTNSSSVYADPCADHVLSFLLAQSRQLPLSLRTDCGHHVPAWQQLRDRCVPLRGSNVLFLGFGAIARRLVELLRPFEVKITALRQRPEAVEGVTIISEAELPTALAETDHVINLLPASAATEAFCSHKRFAAMKPGAVFYNIGRGATVDQPALAEALNSGHLGAAWLDVTDPEPLPPDHPLRHAANCFFTPHVGGGFAGEVDTYVRHFLANLHRLVGGEALRDRVI